MKSREGVIRSYVDAYNRFDLEGMLKNLSSTIHFQNITNGEVTLETKGLKKGEELRLSGKSVFTFNEVNKIEVLIDIS